MAAKDLYEKDYYQILGVANNADAAAIKILQPGYKFKERVIRPARVAVTDPETTA